MPLVLNLKVCDICHPDLIHGLRHTTIRSQIFPSSDKALQAGLTTGDLYHSSDQAVLTHQSRHSLLTNGKTLLLKRLENTRAAVTAIVGVINCFNSFRQLRIFYITLTWLTLTPVVIATT